ncbi:hypothetical protein AAFF_G00058710 [Aldrovandia affinis]|uniref:Uncharacterized protein n=1 Tax=Aldrovandia affinis TaxID=143900 RepID=A0AAD7S0S2_9TELE|nr:hypothetical protein AAFF_G00058710 [Aldrovandia affinis]
MEEPQNNAKHTAEGRSRRCGFKTEGALAPCTPVQPSPGNHPAAKLLPLTSRRAPAEPRAETGPHVRASRVCLLRKQGVRYFRQQEHKSVGLSCRFPGESHGGGVRTGASPGPVERPNLRRARRRGSPRGARFQNATADFWACSEAPPPEGPERSARPEDAVNPALLMSVINR